MEAAQDTSRKVEERAAVVDYGQTSLQVRDLMSNLAQGEQIDWDRYNQISPRARSFLANPHILPNNESYIILSHLVAAPHPSRQDRILESVSQVTSPEQNMPAERQRFKVDPIVNTVKRQNLD